MFVDNGGKVPGAWEIVTFNGKQYTLQIFILMENFMKDYFLVLKEN